MKKKIMLISMCLLLINIITVYSQPECGQVMQTFYKLSRLYRENVYVSFDIKYRYAAQDDPANYRDSLSGHFKSFEGRYWYDLDNTESISLGDYIVVLFKEDKLMYLAKTNQPQINPVGKKRSGELPSNFAGTPVTQLDRLDSFFVKNKNIQCQFTESKEQQVITLNYTVPDTYKQVTIYVDRKTGYIKKIVNIVRADQLYDPSVRSLVEGPVTWAIVECLFSNYSNEQFDTSLFDTNRYFKKEGRQFKTAGKFENYRVFLGSAGMEK